MPEAGQSAARGLENDKGFIEQRCKSARGSTCAIKCKPRVGGSRKQQKAVCKSIRLVEINVAGCDPHSQLRLGALQLQQGFNNAAVELALLQHQGPQGPAV